MAATSSRSNVLKFPHYFIMHLCIVSVSSPRSSNHLKAEILVLLMRKLLSLAVEERTLSLMFYQFIYNIYNKYNRNSNTDLISFKMIWLCIFFVLFAYLFVCATLEFISFLILFFFSSKPNLFKLLIKKFKLVLKNWKRKTI